MPTGVKPLLLAVLLFGACSQDLTRVRLEFRVENDAFRPDYIMVLWQTGNSIREARVPLNGPLPSAGNALGSALISLDSGQPIERRFVARGMRGDRRVSGAVAEVQWSSGRESSVTMTLGCYQDPVEPMPLAGCPASGSPAPASPDADTTDVADAGADVAGDGRPGG